MAKKSKRSRKTAPKKKTANSKKSVAKNSLQPVEKVLKAFHLSKIRKFFSQRKNLVTVLIVLVVFGLLYLFKDVFIVAMVNGRPVYRWTVVQRLEEQGGRQILDSLITEKLVRQAVSEAGIEIDQAQLDADIAAIENRLAAQGLTLDEALAQEGLTRQDLIDDLVLQKSAEQIVADQVEVTEEEIDEYIASNSEFLPEDLSEAVLRDQVREQLYSAKLNEAIQNWVQDLQDNSQIIYLKDYGSLAP
jgi:lambda repressor-like predicted transcriptional regulator